MTSIQRRKSLLPVDVLKVYCSILRTTSCTKLHLVVGSSAAIAPRGCMTSKSWQEQSPYCIAQGMLLSNLKLHKKFDRLDILNVTNILGSLYTSYIAERHGPRPLPLNVTIDDLNSSLDMPHKFGLLGVCILELMSLWRYGGRGTLEYYLWR
jgi:hypothetical protein